MESSLHKGESMESSLHRGESMESSLHKGESMESSLHRGERIHTVIVIIITVDLSGHYHPEKGTISL